MGTLAHDLIDTDNLNTLSASTYAEMIYRGIKLANGMQEPADFVPANGQTNEKYDAQDWVSLATNLRKRKDLTTDDINALKAATEYALAASNKEVDKQLAQITNITTHKNLTNLIEKTNQDYSGDNLSKATALLYIAEHVGGNIMKLRQPDKLVSFQTEVESYVYELSN